MKDDERKNIANTLKKIIAKFDRAIAANTPGIIGETIGNYIFFLNDTIIFFCVYCFRFKEIINLISTY